MLALTANRRYALNAIHPGAKLARVRRRLALAHRFQIGRNTWYVLRGTDAAGMLKVQHGIVGEIGILAER